MPAFDAEVRASGRGSHAVVVPRAVVTALGSRRVRAVVGGETFETTLGTYGGRTFLGLRTSVLSALGVGAGDAVHVELEAAEPVDQPAADAAPVACVELDEALASDEPLARAWRSLPDGHHEEYGRWVAAGSDAETRRARVARLRHRLVPGGG